MAFYMKVSQFFFLFKLPAAKISDFMDPNLIRLMNQPIKEEGQEQEKATLEALRVNISIQIQYFILL